MGRHQVRVPWVVRIADEPGRGAGRKGLPASRAQESTWRTGRSDARRTRLVRAGGADRGGRAVRAPSCAVDSINGSMSPMTDVRASAWFLGECSARSLTAAVSDPP